jgi:hypothetical protein
MPDTFSGNGYAPASVIPSTIDVDSEIEQRGNPVPFN